MREGNNLKHLNAAFAVFLIIVSLASFFTFVAYQQNPPAVTNDESLLLPEVTNCTVQVGVRYSNDSSPYHVMDVYLPVGDGPFPAMIYIHGGGWMRGNRSSTNDDALFYAKRGIAGFSVDYTLSTINSTTWPNSIQDIIKAILYVRANAQTYRIDTGKLGVLGYSAGAQLASFTGTLEGNESFLGSVAGNVTVKNLVCLVVDYSGATDFQYIGEKLQSSTIYKIITVALGNVSYNDNPGLWIQASPASYISHDDPEFVLIHGTNDMVVPIFVAESFNAKLKAAGVKTSFITVTNGDHEIIGNFTENQAVRYQLEPIFKRVFNLNQSAITGFQAAPVRLQE